MEEILKTISKNESVMVHLQPNKEKAFSVVNGVDYNMDTLELKYKEIYAGVTLSIIYSDANGSTHTYPIKLEKGGYMSWMNPIENGTSNYGFIGFQCGQEVFLDFRLK